MQHEFDHHSVRTGSHSSLQTLTSVKEKLPYLEKQFKQFEKQYEEKTQAVAKHKRNMTNEKVKTHEQLQEAEMKLNSTMLQIKLSTSR